MKVKVAGYWAYVDSISLASTKLKDFGGNIVTLPNNTVWGGDIINMTHTDIRKVQLNINNPVGAGLVFAVGCSTSLIKKSHTNSYCMLLGDGG